jgi:hypothetical protein
MREAVRENSWTLQWRGERYYLEHIALAVAAAAKGA